MSLAKRKQRARAETQQELAEQSAVIEEKVEVVEEITLPEYVEPVEEPPKVIKKKKITKK